MDEPISYCTWVSVSTPLKKPPQNVHDELNNAVTLDEKDEFFRVIKDPEFEPVREHRREGWTFLRDFFVNIILKSDCLQIAVAVINGEGKGLIDDDQLVFKDGWTPLHLASVMPSPRLIKYLIERGDPVDVPCDYAPLNLKQVTPFDLALEVIDSGYKNGYETINRPWTPDSSIFELLQYVCGWQRPCLEVLRLLIQNAQNKERVRKAFFDYANEGKLIKLAALFLAAPELFLSSSLGGGSMSSIDALYLNLNSLNKTTDIQDGLALLLDVFDLVGLRLVAYLRVNDPKVSQLSFYANQYKIGFFLREAANKKLGISSRDDYLLRLFKPVSQHVHQPPSYYSNQIGDRLSCKWQLLNFQMKKEGLDIDYVDRMIPSLEPHEADVLGKAIDNKLSIMPNIRTLFEGTIRKPNKEGKQSFSFPSARSIEPTRVRLFCTEVANAKRRLDFKLIPEHGWVMNPTKLESFFSSVRLSRFPMIAKRLIK